MSGESWGELAIAIAALIVMAVAASVDAAVAGLGRHRPRLGGGSADEAGRHRTVRALLDPRRALAGALLVIQVVALAAGASFLTTVVAREVGGAEHALATVLVTASYLVFGRALSLAVAARHPGGAAFGPFARLLAGAARPLASMTDALARGFSRVLPGGVPAGAPAGTEDELRSIAMDGGDEDLIEAEEREMIDGVLHLEEMTVREIMVPRVDMVAVERSASPAEIVATITGAGHSRIPVYHESIDQILGILYAKDLLPYVLGGNDRVPPLVELVRPAFVVPESKRVDDLLKELQRHRIHIAIVADEYGGTAGMLTIEDILEEIVGEIQDEYDREQPLIERLPEGALVADGRLPIEDVEDALGLTFTDDDYGTLGGFVHRHLGRVANEGDRFTAEGVAVEVLTVEGNRVRRLRLERVALLAATSNDATTAAEAEATTDDPDGTRA